MRYLTFTVVGMFLLAAGLTALSYGINQAILVGECGSDGGQAIGPPCPAGVGPMITLMVLGSFVGIFGGGIFSARGRPGGGAGGGLGMGIAIGQLRFWAAIVPAGAAAAVFGIVDFNKEEFQPGLEIIAVSAGSIILVNVLGAIISGRSSSGVSRRKAVPPPPPRPGAAPVPPPTFGVPQAPPSPAPAEAATAPELAEPVRQHDGQTGLAGLGTSTVADSGLEGASQSAHGEVYAQLDRLSELHRSGALSAADYESAKSKLLARL